jgi:hypothetical protein
MKFKEYWIDTEGLKVSAPDKDDELEVSGGLTCDPCYAAYLPARELFALLAVHFEGKPLTFAEISSAHSRITG